MDPDSEVLPAPRQARYGHTDCVTIHLLKGCLQSALYSRDVVTRACGVLMERQGLNHDDALQRLIRKARDTGRTLRQVSADLMAGTSAERN